MISFNSNATTIVTVLVLEKLKDSISLYSVENQSGQIPTEVFAYGAEESAAA
jgi:hypothetical protein